MSFTSILLVVGIVFFLFLVFYEMRKISMRFPHMGLKQAMHAPQHMRQSMATGTVAAANAWGVNPVTPESQMTRYMGDDDEHYDDPSNRFGSGVTYDVGAPFAV